MKPISDALRQAIDNLRKTQLNNAEPSWVVQIFRDKERMLGIIEGDQITSGADSDIQPAAAHGSDDRYYAVFSRGGTIYYMRSSVDNVPRVTWSAPEALFPGLDPDLDFDGEFTSAGKLVTGDLMMVYEEPAGSIQFRRRDMTLGTWSAPAFVANGQNPSIVRNWADPPEIGTQDMGLVVFYTQGGQLMYTNSDDNGATWAAPVAIDQPAGGTKRNAHCFRMSDYTVGVVYEYDNGINAEVWFLKTTRTYVNIASPDESISIRAGSFMVFEWARVNLDIADETITLGSGTFRLDTWDKFDQGADDETITVGSGGFMLQVFTGISP